MKNVFLLSVFTKVKSRYDFRLRRKSYLESEISIASGDRNLRFIFGTILSLCLLMISCTSLGKTTRKNKINVEHPKVAFVGVNVLPMTSDTVFPNQTLMVENGKILEIGNMDSIQIPGDFQIVHCEGKYLMPGLTDMHVHISDDGDMLKFLKYGVTSVRNMSDVTWWAKMMGFSDILPLREKQRQGKVFGPDIYSFGYCLDGKPPVSPMNKKITSVAKAKKEVQKEKKAGYDYIKIYDKLSLDTYDAIIKEAKAVDMPVAGHVPELVGVDRMLDDRVISIEHLTGYIDNNKGDYIIPKDQFAFYLNKTKESGVYNCPTIVVWENIPAEGDFDSLTQDQNFKYLKWYVKWLWKTSLSYYYKISYPDRENYTKHMSGLAKEFTNKLYSSGCPLIVGTDANVIGTYVGYSTLREIELFREAGIPNFDALRAATIVPATALGNDNEIGTIEKGKRANFIVLDENPLEDIKGIWSLSYVYLNHFLFSKKAIDDMVERYYKSSRQ